MSSDWRDGFLFVGNHLALDFLNTRPVMDGQLVEMLPDGAALARWLAAAGLIAERESTRLARRWSSAEFAASMDAVRSFREELRQVVFQIELGSHESGGFIKAINRLLIRHPYVDQLVGRESGLQRCKRFTPESPEDVFAPLADAVADLVTNTDRQRIRKCKNCVVHFYDASKKGTRVWCSMNLCGNRSKVAAFAGRKRRASSAKQVP
jgi:predicted RNA-binding Zn ribbon-like protein